MKTILLLTNYSANAHHAAMQALRLAGKLHANLLLAHSYVLVPVIDYATVVPVFNNEQVLLEEASQEQLKKLAHELQAAIASLPSDERKPQVRYVQMPGNLGDVVQQLCQEHDIELIVAGESQNNRTDHFFFGSDTRMIIEHATSPVLLIPEKTSLKNFAKIVFASNFEDHDLVSLQILARWGKIFHSEIAISHVLTTGDDPKAVKETEDKFRKRIAQLRYPDISYHHVGGAEVPARLRSFCKTEKADLLAMGHEQHGFLGRILHQSKAKATIQIQQLPLLIFPSSVKID